MPTPALAVEHYSFWYDLGENRESLALEDVNFEVERGDFVLILGQSGAGKSTLALNLVGIYPDYFGGRNEGRILVDHPTKGLVNRRDLNAGERFATVNMLFQNPEDQIVTLTVEEEIAFALENYLVPPSEIDGRIDRVLDLVGLPGFRERSTLKLSGGEKQRVALAAMLAMQPRVLLLDEPTSNLDPIGTQEVLDAVNRIRERGDVTIMIVEHEVDEVFIQVDTVILVDGHTVHGPYPPRDFLDRHGLEVRDTMGLWIPQASEVALALREAGIDLPRLPLTGDEFAADLKAVAATPAAAATPVAAATNEAPAAFAAPAATTAPVSEPVIQIRHLSFSYPTKPDILRDVNMEIRSHELLAIVGQNGSGKSTLAAHLNGILKPTSGEVLVDGVPTTKFNFSELVKRVAYIFQMPEKQFIRNNVFDEMAHGLKSLKLPPDEIAQRVETFLGDIRLWDRRENSPYVLSHGQKRRLSVGCMVITEPEVVVLDEPTFGQDYQQARRLMELLRRLADAGAAVTFITHDMRLVAEYADRCVAMCQGQKIFDGTPMQLFGDADVLTRAKLKRPPIHELAEMVLGEPMLDLDAFHEAVKEMVGGRPRTFL